MSEAKMKVLFMGTPDFAVPTLKAIIDGGYEVVGAITQPDKPKGRGYQLLPPPVKVYALENAIPVYQPQTLKGEEFAALLSTLAPDVIVVVAYGKILPVNVLEYPKYGCVNVHGSLLPEYRGAAPMQRAIIDGKTETGITTMLMAAGLDTGDMLLKEVVAIGENDNFEDIHDRLASVGASLLVKTLRGLEAGEITPEVQDDSKSTYAAKIEKSDCALDFSLDAKVLHDKIRGLSPIPLTFTHTPDGKLLKVAKAKLADAEKTPKCLPGTVIEVGEDIKVACGKGVISLLTVLPEGKGRMSAADFVRGRKINVGDILS